MKRNKTIKRRNLCSLAFVEGVSGIKTVTPSTPPSTCVGYCFQTTTSCIVLPERSDKNYKQIFSETSLITY